MATPFTITTPTNAILLDKDRRGLVVFTIANQTGRPLRVRMKVSPFAPTSAEWLTIDGEAERLLPIGSSDTCNVRIAVPPDVAPGPQAFRLDVVSVERPDEEWGQGPAVGFDIAPPPVKEEPRPALGYVETVGGAVIGAVPGVVLGLVVGLPIVLVAAVIALGGATGAFAALTIRAILRPPPWQTAVAYLVAGLVLTALGQFVAVAATPAPAGALVLQTAQPFILQTTRPLILQTAIVLLTAPPIRVTAFPVTIAPTSRPVPTATATAAPVAEPTAPAPALSVTLALIGVVLASLAARAGTRWREFGTV